MNLDDVPDCLRNIADAIEADPGMARHNVVVLVRSPDEATLQIYGFGETDGDSAAVFTECHVAAAQLLDLMRAKPCER